VQNNSHKKFLKSEFIYNSTNHGFIIVPTYTMTKKTKKKCCTIPDD